jgi:hypothetical protein
MTMRSRTLIIRSLDTLSDPGPNKEVGNYHTLTKEGPLRHDSGPPPTLGSIISCYLGSKVCSNIMCPYVASRPGIRHY